MRINIILWEKKENLERSPNVGTCASVNVNLSWEEVRLENRRTQGQPPPYKQMKLKDIRNTL